MRSDSPRSSGSTIRDLDSSNDSVSHRSVEYSARNAGNVLPFILYSIAFVTILLAVVAMKGGGNFNARIQQLDTLRISIQSEDAARELLDDPVADIALIESFLYPSPDRHDKAVAFYEQWRSDKEWDLSYESASIIDIGSTAKVGRAMAMARDGRIRIYSDDENWEKHNGVWYRKEAKEILLKEFDLPVRGRVLP